MAVCATRGGSVCVKKVRKKPQNATQTEHNATQTEHNTEHTGAPHCQRDLEQTRTQSRHTKSSIDKETG